MPSEPITRNGTTQSWFDQARLIKPDAIFALTAQYLADKSPTKANLGQGTYRVTSMRTRGFFPRSARVEFAIAGVES
ncbi:Aspartate aminotransferase [Penicillium vulpinum]|uniref:Aspartate aminotransferase n=1 Tax=Penicillium vulpinum TaxID=29845 RepID=UPI0025496469|nr:Aspartate aminotransferase [Penicillium vulpinum]KAJ5971542.1 Aspartate aminotransferase [Penicillium vulpinum]